MMRCALAVVALVVVFTGDVRAQTPRVAPRALFELYDERVLGPYVVQRWVPEAAPDIASDGMCECVVVVYRAGRRVLGIGHGSLTSMTFDDRSGRDLTGDGIPDLAVTEWSGGDRCCSTTTMYSMEAEPRVILSVPTGMCRGGFDDLDGDGRLEFVSCDDRWLEAYCAFDDSPRPPVVFAFDAEAREYRLATARFAVRFRDDLARRLEEAQQRMVASDGENAGDDKCAVLHAALGLIYTGRFTDGMFLLRSIYGLPDRDAFERDTLQRVQASPLAGR